MQQKFKELQDKFPHLSSAMIYSKLVKGRKMNKTEIAKWFRLLVDKEDYENMDKDNLRLFYHKLSNGLK